MDLKNKVIVITGASRGLGKELALQLSQKGSKLALVARSEKELIQLQKEIEANGNICEYFVCDVSNDKQVLTTAQKIAAKFEKIDILVNNAGIWWEGPLEKHSPEKVKEIFDVVTLGTIYFSMAVLPIMKKQKEGTILNVISVAGIETPGQNGQYAPYTAAKHAITGFTKSLEEEVGKEGIKVLGFYPAGMNTELFRTSGFKYSDSEDWMMNKKDIAEIIVFILSRPKDISMDQVIVRKFPPS